jgi:hypothetical protein
MDFQSQLRVATCGFRSAPAVYDFDHDGFPDIISGTFAGGLNYYKGISAPYVGICPTEHVLNPNIRLYPNPSRDNFTLAMDDMQYVKTVKIEIMDLSGRLMYSQSHKPSSAMNINVNELKSGLYLVNVHIQDTDNQTSIRTVKLIKN